MVDRDKAGRLLEELSGCLSDLRRYRNELSREDLSIRRDAQHMVLHAFYVAAQATLDLAMHVGADAGLPQALSYQDAFRRLEEAGLIEPDLAKRLTGWAGFRNVLAHFYATVDYDRVYDALGEIEDLERFAALIAARITAS